MNLAEIKPAAGELLIDGEAVDYLDTMTMLGLESIATCLGSPFNFTDSWMPYVGVGSGPTEPSSENAYLEAEVYRKKADRSAGEIYVDGNRYIVDLTFGADEPDSAYVLREVGLLNSAKGGILAARWVTALDYNIAADSPVRLTCIIIIA